MSCHISAVPRLSPAALESVAYATATLLSGEGADAHPAVKMDPSDAVTSESIERFIVASVLVARDL
jgi:hypothetical protein